MGAGSPEVRISVHRNSACPVAHRAAALLAVGVSLAVPRQVVDVRRLLARNAPQGSDRAGQHSDNLLPDDVLCMEVTVWERASAITGFAS